MPDGNFTNLYVANSATITGDLYVEGTLASVGSLTAQNSLIVGAGGIACLGQVFMAGDLSATTKAILPSSNLPLSGTANGTKGEIRVGTDFLYACVATNQWKVIPLFLFSMTGILQTGNFLMCSY